MNSIIWKGVSSTTINGLIISELPPITKPEMRVQETIVDGRDGSIIEELGYASYDKTILIGLHGNFNIDEVIKYFTGEGDIVFSNEPDKVYKAKICGRIDYTRLLRYRQASILFKVEPYKYKLNEYLTETPTEVVTGTTLAINNNAEDKLKSFKIYGKSTQDGTPTPETPVDIVSIGDDGGVVVSVNEQSITVQTPNGLRGIPVSSGGNYTDASGQQWVCDEIDFNRKIYIRRLNSITFNGTEIWNYFSDNYSINQFHTKVNDCYINNSLVNAISPQLQGITVPERNKNYNTVYTAGQSGISYICVNIEGFTGQTPFIAFLKENPIEVFYRLNIPIETPLTEEEIALYKNLISNAPTISISNDENAHMMVEYFKPFEVFNEGFEDSKPLMVLKGSGTVEISVNGVGIFSYTFPEGENEVYIDSEKEDAYLGNVLKNRNMNGEFPILTPKTNKIEWSGDIESISILPRSRWL